jgi:small subunit ribosomal protein S6
MNRKEMKNMIHIYETVIIFKNKKDVLASVNKYEKMLHGFSGKPVKTDIHGEKSLAYAVDHHKKGYYVTYLYYSNPANPENITELERLLRIDSNVLKFMTVRHDEYAAEYAKQLEQLAQESEQKVIDAWDVIFGRAVYN